MKDYTLSDKFKYWLDKQMSKGTASIIKLLSLVVITIVILISIAIVIFELSDGFFTAFWDSLATIVNAWMPSSDDGQLGYIILNTIAAIVGLFFTSILIGVISNGIEEKLDSLRNGSSTVIEKNHTVILGYNHGEHGLINQLIIAAEKEKRTFVIFTDLEKTALEQDLHNNVDIPKNITVICRHGDITNTNDLRCCSIDKSSVVIINALNDNKRIKSILAVMMLMKEYKECTANVVACVSNEKYLLPSVKIRKKNIIMLKTDDMMAQMIAHTATEPGLSVAFKELLNFEGNEFYFEKDDRFINKSVKELLQMIDNATLVGIKHNGKVTLNPKREMIVEEDDEIILFEIGKGTFTINDIGEKRVSDKTFDLVEKESKGKLYIIGSNVLLETILSELPDDIKDITIVTKDKNLEIASTDKKTITVSNMDCEINLEKIASKARHIVILADRDIDKEDSDIKNVLLVLKLMDIKERNDYEYNITAELNMENSYRVALKNNQIDYIVSSNVASLVLAQISENPNLEEVFKELLSKKGNELFSKSLNSFNLTTEHDYSYGGLKQIVLSYGYILLGYSKKDEMFLNLPLEERITFEESDRLIVLGRE